MSHTTRAWRGIEPNDRAWDAFVDGHKRAHLLQTSAWSALKERSGWSAFRVALVEDAGDGEIAAGASVLLRSVFGLKIAYIPRGPLTDWADAELTLRLFDVIEMACRQRGAALLKIEPGLPDTPAGHLLLKRYGFALSAQTVQPQSTIVLDIAGDEESILKRMKSKWRYNIRLAERKEVAVTAAEAQDLDVFNELMAATGARDGFGVHSPQYYRDAYGLLVPGRAVYLMAEYAGEPLAAIVVAATGDTAWYLWGASSDRERNRMPNHALQWAGIQWARSRGATRYDLWGIPDDLGKVAIGLSRDGAAPVDAEALPVELAAMPSDELWGVFRFKQGFGGEVVRDVGAWDKPLGTLGHRLYGAGLAARKHGSVLPARVRSLAFVAVYTNGGVPAQGTPVVSPQEWRAVLGMLPEPHVLQSWEWGDVKAQTGWRAERIALPNAGEPIAAYQFLWREAAANVPMRIGYVPKGPVVDWRDGSAVNAALDAIEAHARSRGCLFVKIDPDVRSDLAEGVVLAAKLKRRGWRFSCEQIQFQNTATSDLTLCEEELLAAMKSKWRYNIRLAERRGVSVRAAGADDLPDFYAMYAETGERDGFLIRPYGYYATTWRRMLAAQQDASNPAGGALLLAEHADESQPLAGLFLMKYGDRAWYFYGASTDNRRRDMPNYLLQWEALLWAQRQGCTVYDWWGAPTDLDNLRDPMQGVWQFKQGFGAVFQPHTGAWDFVTMPPLYALYTQAVPKALELMKRRRKRER